MTFNYSSSRKRRQDWDQVGREEGMSRATYWWSMEHMPLRDLRSQGVKRRREESRGLRRSTWPAPLGHAFSGEERVELVSENKKLVQHSNANTLLTP